MSYVVAILLFPLVTLPSIIYGVSSYALLPLGFVLSLFTGKPSSFRASTIAVKLTPIFLVVGVPLILYFYLSKLAGWIFFGWIVLYLIIRRFSGISARERQITRGWQEAHATGEGQEEREEE